MVMLKFEDYVYAVGPDNEWVNSNNICRIRVKRKRICIWMNNSGWNYIYVGKTKHNLEELKKLEE